MSDEIRYSSILILSPPFYSHFRPLRSLARALADLGAELTIASDESFRDDVIAAGLNFRPLSLSRNANNGNARLTKQAAEEHHRLEEFLEATSHGPIETLLTQARHRRADMLPDPEGLADDLEVLYEELKPELWIVDQLSFGATLALTGMKQKFITFCAPHPSAISAPGELYGVPRRWPEGFALDNASLSKLKSAALENDRLFTSEFNRILTRRFNATPVESAFRHTSDLAIIYNYPHFGGSPLFGTPPSHIFSGHSVENQPLPEEWRDWTDMKGPSILIALGTFLSSRIDVIERLVTNLCEILPDIRLAVGAGDGSEKLTQLSNQRIRIEPFVPQRALLNRVDLAIHHGGVSSFTETLHAGKPAIVLPFSSDQFDVARDVQDYKLGSVMNPNTFSSQDLTKALRYVKGVMVQKTVAAISKEIQQRGPAWTARKMLLKNKET